MVYVVDNCYNMIVVDVFNEIDIRVYKEKIYGIENLWKNKFDIHNAVSNIVFISDLHFDYTEGHYMLEQAQRKEDEFVNYVKQNYSSAILCVCGDFIVII